jgi:hypothetical protein
MLKLMTMLGRYMGAAQISWSKAKLLPLGTKSLDLQ